MMAEMHAAGPGHTQCSWEDESRFVAGEWPRDADGRTKVLRAPDFRRGHQGPWALVILKGGKRLQDYCRVCSYICVVDYHGDPPSKSLGGPLCSSTCAMALFTWINTYSGPTTEEIVTGTA